MQYPCLVKSKQKNLFHHVLKVITYYIIYTIYLTTLVFTYIVHAYKHTENNMYYKLFIGQC